jgi:hypothetical protein
MTEYPIEHFALWEHVVRTQYQAAQRGKLSMWTIYDHPSDYPDDYVARRWDIDVTGQVATPDIIGGAGDDLAGLRDTFRRAGLHCMGREPGDDAKIVETWL